MDNNDTYQKWITLASTLKSPYLQYFLEIQDLINELQEQLDSIENCESLINRIKDLINTIVQVVDTEYLHLLDGFEQSLKLFLKIDPSEKVPQHQAINLSQELFNKVAITYFFKEEDELKEQENYFQNLNIQDGTSTCSDFSDDIFEVEDFEAQVAQELFENIRIQLNNPDIESKCISFEFRIVDGELNIVDFFQDALQMAIRQYDVIIFLNFSGLLQKLMNQKGNNQLQYFIQQLFMALHKIKNESIEELIDQNSFEMKYTRLSQRKFLKCKMIASLYSKLVYEKLEKWRLSQNIQDIQGENLKELRRFIIEHKAPLSRWEVSILSIQDIELNYNNVHEKLQKLIIALQLDYNLLLANFISIDKLYVDMRQFERWVKLSNIPLSTKEIFSLFNQCSQIYGYYTKNGVKVVQRCNYYEFLDNLFQVQQDQEIGQQYKQHKYSDQVTLEQYNKHLQLKVAHLQQQLQQQQQQQQQQQNTQQSEIQQVQQQQDQSTLDSSLQENLIRQEIQWKSEMEIMKNEYQQQIKLQDLKHKTKIRDLLFELENKDKQIDHYRMQLEALIKELEWVKTERTN